MANVCRFVSEFQKRIYFYVRQLEKPKKCISKMRRHHLYLFVFVLAVAQVKTKILLRNFVCVLFCMYLDHIYSVFFLKISSDFENISRNQNFWLENLKILRFFVFGNFESSFLCQAIVCLWPAFGVSKLLIWFSAIFSH